MRSLSVGTPPLFAAIPHVALLGLLALSCSASGGGGEESLLAAPAPRSPSSDDSSSVGGSGGAPPVTSPLPTDGLLDDLDPSGQAPGCQQASRSFDPEIPTVFLLVDRSRTMFGQVPGVNETVWSSLRGGVLQVIGDLQDQVRFGFSAFTGATGCQIPLMETASAALNNFDNISQLYMKLEEPTDPQVKETPTVGALDIAANALWADEGTGDKFILYVTDGQPDYCDDGNQLCPTDSVAGKLQRLAAGLADDGTQQQPIRTFVFGVQSAQADVPPEVLQAFANAGAGQPVASLQRVQNGVINPNSIYDECQQVAGWRSLFDLTGKADERTESTATYAEIGGTATVYRPDPADQGALTEEIRLALAGVKSCEFNLGEDGVEVDLARPDLGEKAHVTLNGSELAFEDPNGWRMLNSTTVELVGTACNTFRAPLQTDISFDFPCDIIVVY